MRVGVYNGYVCARICVCVCVCVRGYCCYVCLCVCVCMCGIIVTVCDLPIGSVTMNTQGSCDGVGSHLV